MRLIVDWKQVPARFIVKRPLGYGISYKHLGGLKQKPKRAERPVKI